MTPLWRRAAAELVGTAALVTTVVGSGITAQGLTDDEAVRLLTNSITTFLGLAVLITVFLPISGAHFNPVVSLANWWLGRRDGSGITATECGVYAVVQIGGGIAGAVLANLMFALPAVAWSQHARTGGNLWLAEVVATAGLLVVIVSLVRSGKTGAIAATVGAYIGAAVWFTASTSFANPAVTVGRMFTDTYTGIAAASVPGFVAAQLAGLIVAMGLLAILHPTQRKA